MEKQPGLLEILIDIAEQCDERFASIPISYHVMTKEKFLQKECFY